MPNYLVNQYFFLKNIVRIQLGLIICLNNIDNQINKRINVI